METLIRDVRLWGALGERFGHHHRLAVGSPAEAIAALEANRPGFLAYIGRLHHEGNAFACFIGDKNIRGDQLYVPLGAESFEIAPRIRGAGDNAGVVELILGIVLITVGWFVLGPAGPAAGIAILGSAGFAEAVIMVGVSLTLAGAASLLTPKPKFDAQQDETSKSRPSDFFGGAVNTTAQGQPVPVLLGQLYIGSATISIGVENEDRTMEEAAA